MAVPGIAEIADFEPKVVDNIVDTTTPSRFYEQRLLTSAASSCCRGLQVQALLQRTQATHYEASGVHSYACC